MKAHEWQYTLSDLSTDALSSWVTFSQLEYVSAYKSQKFSPGVRVSVGREAVARALDAAKSVVSVLNQSHGDRVYTRDEVKEFVEALWKEKGVMV